MIIPFDMAGKTLAVLGLGRSGMASVSALVAAGATVHAHDDAASPPLPEGAISAPPSAWPWEDMTALVMSPGIPHAFPAPHPAAELARANGVPIISDIELLINAGPVARVVGITGTNGKSTTVKLLGHLLKEAGVPVAVGGNIGTAALALDDPGPEGVIVLELSSYQLETTPSLRLDAGALINITPDHLDRHGGWEGYIAAKRRLVEAIKPEGMLVLGRDPDLVDLAGPCAGKVAVISPEDAPFIGLRENLPGPHNIENGAIAFRLGRFLGLDEAVMLGAIPGFKGLPHRMEIVGFAGPIRFVNDSKGTNSDAALQALRSYTSIYWIAGGLSKEKGIGTISAALGNIRRAYLIGKCAESFAADLAGKVEYRMSGTLDQAIRTAFADAREDNLPEATILLAPAAASFDQFAHFEERGDTFRRKALELIAATPPEETAVGHV
ncbi:UDP-N-acetylmuramoyl-L-alanine--D-glutamate ligase [Alphaproteobacteria bacterium LSUCC0684]